MKKKSAQKLVLSNEDKIKSVATSFAHIMETIGLDLTDASLKDTPMRVAKMYVNEMCGSVDKEPPPLTLFPNDKHYDQMVMVEKIGVTSVCEHHFQPIIGDCQIAYLPGKEVLGLSKFVRIVRYFAGRPQVQERLTQEIGLFLIEQLGTSDVAVVIRAEHFCMKCRGVYEKDSKTTTSFMSGSFRGELRNEFLMLAYK